MRWALVEASWRVVRPSASWRRIYEGIRKRAGSKKAIVAVARRLLGVMDAMLRDGTNSNLLSVGESQPTEAIEAGVFEAITGGAAEWWRTRQREGRRQAVPGWG